MQWTDWAFLEKHKKDCQAFKDGIDMCKYHGLQKIMAFQYDWNEEVILSFNPPSSTKTALALLG
jgi:hypothetical protein